MVRKIRIVHDEDELVSPEQRALNVLHGMSDDVVACRGQGHAWPKLKPGKPVKGIRHAIIPESGGQVELTFICPDCGKKRRVITAPSRMIDYPAEYHYEDPPGYRLPRGMGKYLRRRDFFGEANRRWAEDAERRFGGVPPAYEDEPNGQYPPGTVGAAVQGSPEYQKFMSRVAPVTFRGGA